MLLTEVGLATRQPVGIGKPGYCITPNADLTYKEIRMRGITIAVMVAYFKDTIGFTGQNIDLVNRIHQVTVHSTADAALVMADFNMQPQVQDEDRMSGRRVGLQRSEAKLDTTQFEEEHYQGFC